MRVHLSLFLISLFLILFSLIPCSAAVDASRVLAFEARDAAYVSHGPAWALSVNSAGAVLTIGRRTVRLSIPGARPTAPLDPLDRMPGKATYISGSRAPRSYELYRRVRARSVYPGIDLLYHGNQQHLEYDFEIAAHRDPSRIRLAFDGIDGLHIDPHGDLVLTAGPVTIRQPKPIAFQLDGAQTLPVEAAYVLAPDHHVRFRLGAYNRSLPLTIDPQILFENPFGGSGQSYLASLARDSQGALYVTGLTNSTDLGTVNPAQGHLGTAPLLVSADGQNWASPSLGAARSVNAVAASPSAPQIVYAATQLGISKSTDGGTTWTLAAAAGLPSAPNLLAVDAASASIVYTAAGQAAFVSTDGAATFRPMNTGSTGPGVATIVAHPSQAGTVFVAISNAGGLYRSTDSGQTFTRLPTPVDRSAPVVTVLFRPDGALIIGTPVGLYISTDSGATWTPGANQIVFNTQGLVMSSGNPAVLYIVGFQGLARSTDGGLTFTPVLPSVNFSSFARLAADPRDPATAYAIDYNLFYRTTDSGQTWSPVSLPYPVEPQTISLSPDGSKIFIGTSTQSGVFVTKWSADGSQVLYSTYLSGSVGEGAKAIAVDAAGSAYVTGYTSSPDFPTTSGAFQTKFDGHQATFVAKLSPDGARLVYSTFLGNASDFPSAIAVDSSGNALVAGSAVSGFPVTANAFQTAPVPGCDVQIPLEITVPAGDAFIAKLAADGSALVYGTLLGGNCATYATSIALDSKGNAWVSGSTVSTNFPVTADALQSKPGGGYYDGFLARFNPSGGLDYSSYIGGPGYDIFNAIAFDAAGNIFLAGESGGLSQAASPGAYQPQANASCPAFSIGPGVYSLEGNGLVLKLDPAAHSVLRLTYLGAPGCLSPTSLAVDSAGEPWIAGGFGATSPLPTVNPVRLSGPGYIVRFSADFTRLLFSTYFDSVSGLALDASGLAYVAGTTATQKAFLAKVDSTPATISIDSIASTDPAASPNNFRGIAAGEILRLMGRGIGPATSVPGAATAGVLSTSVAGVAVTFDGTPAPLLWVSAQEIDLITPFSLAGKSSTTIQVQYNGLKSNPVQLGVDAVDVQVLSVLNEDFSANTASNPAKTGSVISIYLAGLGQTSPPSQDGQINTTSSAPATPVQIESFLNNPNGIIPITFAGAAPGLAAGIYQINFVAPPQSKSTLSVAVGNFTFASFSVYAQ